MSETECYLVTCGEYSDYRVVGAFSSKDKADDYIANLVDHDETDSWRVEIFEVDPPLVEFRKELHMVGVIKDGVRYDLPPEYTWSRFNEYRGCFDRAAWGHHWMVPFKKFEFPYLSVSVEGWDHERVRKVYSELMARTVAEPPPIPDHIREMMT